MLTIREYKKVQSLEEAWELNQKRANRVIGGMMWMRLGDSNFQTAIDLSRSRRQKMSFASDVW